LESNVALIQVSSGLERLMVGTPKTGVLKDSNVAQISAFLYFQANVIAQLTTNQKFKSLFQNTIFNQIEKDFSLYVDSQARMKPKSLHHVYEWGKTGDPTARLFILNPINSNTLSFQVRPEFLLSRSFVPNDNKGQHKRYIFSRKASIMEKNQPVVISPKSAERLVFEINGETVYMPKGQSVIVNRPGGSASSNAFTLQYSRWFSGPLISQSIKNSGFEKIFNIKTAKALKIPASIKRIQYSFAANKIRVEADASVAAAFGGSL
jgi:hypothetical protein